MNRLDNATHGVVNDCFKNIISALDWHFYSGTELRPLSQERLIKAILEYVAVLPVEVRKYYTVNHPDLEKVLQIIADEVAATRRAAQLPWIEKID